MVRSPRCVTMLLVAQVGTVTPCRNNELYVKANRLRRPESQSKLCFAKSPRKASHEKVLSCHRSTAQLSTAFWDSTSRAPSATHESLQHPTRDSVRASDNRFCTPRWPHMDILGHPTCVTYVKHGPPQAVRVSNLQLLGQAESPPTPWGRSHPAKFLPLPTDRHS